MQYLLLFQNKIFWKRLPNVPNDYSEFYKLLQFLFHLIWRPKSKLIKENRKEKMFVFVKKKWNEKGRSLPDQPGPAPRTGLFLLPPSLWPVDPTVTSSTTNLQRKQPASRRTRSPDPNPTDLKGFSSARSCLYRLHDLLHLSPRKP